MAVHLAKTDQKKESCTSDMISISRCFVVNRGLSRTSSQASGSLMIENVYNNCIYCRDNSGPQQILNFDKSISSRVASFFISLLWYCDKIRKIQVTYKFNSGFTTYPWGPANQLIVENLATADRERHFHANMIGEECCVPLDRFFVALQILKHQKEKSGLQMKNDSGSIIDN